MSKEFNVSCFNINNTDIILLEFLLSVIEKTTDTQWILTSGVLSDIAIFNTDELEGIEHYEKAIKEQSHPICITYSSMPISAENHLHLNKPLRSSDFIVLINKVLDDSTELGKEIPANHSRQQIRYFDNRNMQASSKVPKNLK